MTGRVLGDRYRVLRRIGEGGMGTVYLCEHVALGRKMAVKLLRPEFCADEELVRRFQQEAQAASQIGQENIIDVLDFGRTTDGSLYFVMEALEGENLASLLRREGALAPRRALPILNQICRALGAAHAQGIVHRDLKPDNVFLLRQGDCSDFVKVLDFGISKHSAAPESHRITRAGSIIGTPEYMAPEQAAATTVDHRCDIYAFGVLAYEMLTGTLPFQGETALATLIMHQNDPPEPPTKRKPDLPPELEHLILRAMVKRPQGRHQSMAEVADDLLLAMTAIGLAPGGTPAPEPAALPSLAPATARFTLVPPSPLPRRRALRGETLALVPEVEVRSVRTRASGRWRRVAAVAAVSVALGAAAGIAWRWRSSAPTTAAAPAPSAAPVAKLAEPPPPPPPTAQTAPEAPAASLASARIAPEPPAKPPGVKKPSAKAPATRERRRVVLRSAPKPAAAARRAMPAQGDDPYGKVEDLKPDPFREPPAEPTHEPLRAPGAR